MRAIQISSFGNPADVLTLINANDLMLIKGTFHYTPSLPTIVGNEGVGGVLAIGLDVQSVNVGDRVLLPLYSNSWRERIVVPARKLVSLPPEADVRQLAMLRINPPAAALMLSWYYKAEFGRLSDPERCQFRRRPRCDCLR
jgi:NADPH:quinone reductase-like Zn-dependent oxidoreductase